MGTRVRLTKRNVLVGLMILSVATAVFGRRVMAPVRQLLAVVLAPLGDGGMYVVTSLRAGAGEGAAPGLSSADIQRLLEENQALADQLAELERRLAEQARLHRQVMEDMQQLRSSFLPSDDSSCELIPARVVAAGSLPYGQVRMLNQGAASGAAPGSVVLGRLLMTDRSKELPPRLAVLTASAVVGRLAASGPFTSQLQLVTDAGFEIRGRILRRIDPNRPRQVHVLVEKEAAVEVLNEQNNRPIPVLARGDGADGLIVRDVPSYDNVLPGDWLVTTDDDPHLRTEVRIGTVKQVAPNPNDARFVTLHVRPFEDLGSLRNVYILYWKPP